MRPLSQVCMGCALVNFAEYTKAFLILYHISDYKSNISSPAI